MGMQIGKSKKVSLKSGGTPRISSCLKKDFERGLFNKRDSIFHICP